MVLGRRCRVDSEERELRNPVESGQDSGGKPIIYQVKLIDRFCYICSQESQQEKSKRKEALIMKKSGSQTVESASRLIDARIQDLGDWRGEMLSRLRALIKQADPKVVEEWKWGIPVWSHDGIVCTGETYKKVVKMTFAKGAALKDPSGLFNSSLEGNVRRAIDIHEGEKVDEVALKDLIRAGVALNVHLKSKSKPKPGRASSKRAG
jgi:hypothetical protein